jgi:hypothetical protein
LWYEWVKTAISLECYKASCAVSWCPTITVPVYLMGCQ